MATRTLSPVFGKRIRITKLDECGNVPDAGETDSMAVTDGFITVSLSSEIEDGDEITQKNAAGHLCINERTDSSFKYFTGEIEFCEVDPGILSLITNVVPYEDADDTIGFYVPEGTITQRFALELWTGLAGQSCPEDVEEASGYLLLPFMKGGSLGDIEVGGEDAVTFTVSDMSSTGGNGWGVGPYDVVDGGPLPNELDEMAHLLMIETGVAPPPSASGLQDMPNGGGSGE